MKKIVLSLAGLALLTACGGSKPNVAAGTVATIGATATTATTAPAVSMADLAQKYQDAVAAANTAGDTFNTKMAKLGDNPSSSQLGDIAEPLGRAFQAADQTLLRLPWPATIKPDVNALVTADSAMEGDLLTVRSQSANIFSAAAWVQQFTADAGKVHAAVSIVRADLGLPPAKS